jgi:hypothetical protein
MAGLYTSQRCAAVLCVTMLLPGSTSLAQPAATPVKRTLTVSGEGEVHAAPDEAHLSAGVVTSARSAAEALAANTRAMNAIFATAKRLGIPDRAITTSNFSVSPQYAEQRKGDTAEKVSSYEVNNTVDLTVDLAQLGPALDALVSSGANSLGNIAFAIRDPKPLLEQARAAAMKDAIARAKTYAAAGGFALGPILSVIEGDGSMPHPMIAAPMRMAAAPVPIAGGEGAVSANVSVRFEIH